MDRIATVINHLEQHLDQAVSLDQLAKVAFLSPVQLYRLFKKATGLTPIQYHEHLRIAKGLEQLVEVDSVGQVAYDLGYKNYETFSRAFKKLCHLSPNDLLWGISRAEAEHQDGKYILLQEEATLEQVVQLIRANDKAFVQAERFPIYRIYPQAKRKADIRRCQHTESLLKRKFQ